MLTKEIAGVGTLKSETTQCARTTAGVSRAIQMSLTTVNMTRIGGADWGRWLRCTMWNRNTTRRLCSHQPALLEGGDSHYRIHMETAIQWGTYFATCLHDLREVTQVYDVNPPYNEVPLELPACTDWGRWLRCTMWNRNTIRYLLSYQPARIEKGGSGLRCETAMQ